MVTSYAGRKLTAVIEIRFEGGRKDKKPLDKEELRRLAQTLYDAIHIDTGGLRVNDGRIDYVSAHWHDLTEVEQPFIKGCMVVPCNCRGEKAGPHAAGACPYDTM
jgi:hypothetical protein